MDSATVYIKEWNSDESGDDDHDEISKVKKIVVNPL